MNLDEAITSMDRYPRLTKEQLKGFLTDGMHVLACDENNYGIDMIRYDFFCDGRLLICGKLSNSTADEIVITPESTAVFNDKYVDMIWDGYISGKDFFLVDVTGIMHEARIQLGQWNLETLNKSIKPDEIIYFNDIYSPMKNLKTGKTNIYIIDNAGAKFVGMDAVKQTIESITGASVTTDKASADFNIVILPNTAKPSEHVMFEWLNEENPTSPAVKNVLSEKHVQSKKEKPILLYWSSTAFMMGLMDPNRAQYQAAIELETRIKEFHQTNGNGGGSL